MVLNISVTRKEVCISWSVDQLSVSQGLLHEVITNKYCLRGHKLKHLVEAKAEEASAINLKLRWSWPVLLAAFIYQQIYKDCSKVLCSLKWSSKQWHLPFITATKSFYRKSCYPSVDSSVLYPSHKGTHANSHLIHRQRQGHLGTCHTKLTVRLEVLPSVIFFH
jgi:hypothetical protein